MSIIYPALRKRWLHWLTVTSSFLQVGSEAGLSSCKHSSSCVYLETCDSFCRTTENIRGEPGLHSARPCRDLNIQGQKLFEALTTVKNLRQRAKTTGMKEEIPKDKGRVISKTVFFSPLCTTESRNWVVWVHVGISEKGGLSFCD